MREHLEGGWARPLGTGTSPTRLLSRSLASLSLPNCSVQGWGAGLTLDHCFPHHGALGFQGGDLGLSWQLLASSPGLLGNFTRTQGSVDQSGFQPRGAWMPREGLLGRHWLNTCLWEQDSRRDICSASHRTGFPAPPAVCPWVPSPSHGPLPGVLLSCPPPGVGARPGHSLQPHLPQHSR